MTQQCDIQNNSCTSENNNNECCDMPEKLLALADEAWFEVLKKKMQKEIERSCGDQMAKLATFVVETNKAKWSHEIQGKVSCDEYKTKLKEMFTTDCQD